jgi:streptogramin lyase
MQSHGDSVPQVIEFPFGLQPYGLTCADDGAVYYTDSGAKRIGRIAQDGTHITRHLPSLADRPFGLAIDDGGLLWITEWSNSGQEGEPAVQLVSRIDFSSGSYESCPVSSYGTPRNITPGRGNRMWFTIGALLGSVTHDGELSIHEPSWTSPWKSFESNGLTVTPNGLIWMGVGGRESGLASFNPMTTEWHLYRLDGIHLQSLSAAPDGRIWFTSFGSKRIGWLDGDRTTVVSFDGSPFGILAASATEIWVSDFENNRLALVDPGSGEPIRYVNLATSRGEPQVLSRDPSGNLWVSLQKGSIACVSGSTGPVRVPKDDGSAGSLMEPAVLPRDLRLSLRASSARRSPELPPNPSPIRAIFSPHPSFIAPDADLELWRYIDLPKLISMLHERALFFARLDSQSDRFEGSLPSRTLDDEVASLLPISMRDRPELRQHFDTMRSSVSLFRSRALLSCWHANDHESTAMWDLYSQTNHGIAIRTTVERVRRSLDSAALPAARPRGELSGPGEDRMAYFIGAVRYLDYERDLFLPSTGLDYLTCKRKSYDYEREVRLVMLSDTPLVGGQQVACSVDELVEAVYISPTAPKWFYAVVRAVLERFQTGWDLRQSDLARDPLL